MVLSWDQSSSLGGAFLVLSAYALQSFVPARRYHGLYLLLNLTGATGLLLAAWQNKQYGFIILQAFWIIISLVGLIRLTVKKV